MVVCGEAQDLGSWGNSFFGESAGRRKGQVREFGNCGVTREEVGAIQDRRGTGKGRRRPHSSWGKLEAGADRGDHRGRQEERGQEPREDDV